MLDEVVSGLILAALTPGGGDGEFFARRKAKRFLAGKPVDLPAHLYVEGHKPRAGRVRLDPDHDDLLWWPAPRLGRARIPLGTPLGRAPVTRTQTADVPAHLRGPAWVVEPDRMPAVLLFSTAISRVFGPVLDGGEAPDPEQYTEPRVQLRRLMRIVSLLAANTDAQRAELDGGRWQDYAGDLGLEFADAWRRAEPHFDELGVDPAHIRDLQRLAQALDDLDQRHGHLWTPEAVDLPEWQRVREIARPLSESLG